MGLMYHGTRRPRPRVCRSFESTWEPRRAGIKWRTAAGRPARIAVAKFSDALVTVSSTPRPMLNCADWVVLTDRTVAAALTDRQLAVLTEYGCPGVRVVDCAADGNAALPPCQTLPYFPSMCNVQAASCSPGVHEAAVDLEALVELASRAPAPAV
jgi:hypothetical protein